MSETMVSAVADAKWSGVPDVVTRHDPSSCWEDIQVDSVLQSDPYVVTEDEIIAFARGYDPLPIHVDREVAASGPFGVITAPGSMILAIRQRLMNDFAFPGGVIACVGFDDVRFLAPLRAGQSARVEAHFLDKRPSASRPDRGIVAIGITLFADDRPILTLKDTVLMRRSAE